MHVFDVRSLRFSFCDLNFLPEDDDNHKHYKDGISKKIYKYKHNYNLANRYNTAESFTADFTYPF